MEIGQKSILLLSGGIDSCALAYWLRPKVALTIDYGQKAANAEIAAATVIARSLDIEHIVIRTDLREIGAGVMSGSQQLDLSPTPEWWPFRNQLLVTIAAAIGVKHDCFNVIIGTVQSDSLHADGQAPFIEVLDRLLHLQEGHLRLLAPAAIYFQKDLIRVSGVSPRLLSVCHSCHISNIPCGKCRGCKKALEARLAVGIDSSAFPRLPNQ